MRIIIVTFMCEDQKYLSPYSGWLQTKHILAILQLITLICQLYVPKNDHLANIPAISVDEPDLCTNTVEDQCHSGFCRTFVPSVHPTMTEEESIRQIIAVTCCDSHMAYQRTAVTTGDI